MSQFKIFIDRLKDGQTFSIEENYTPDFLHIDEKELRFLYPVVVQGKAYLTTDHLILQFSIKAQISMPCSICNDFFTISLPIEDLLHAEPLAEIPQHIFDFSKVLREAILLQVPPFAECQEGACPERAHITSFLKKDRHPSQDVAYYPFNDL
jgi:uncharacterized metal-binding protein YceD (DUF177 family)